MSQVTQQVDGYRFEPKSDHSKCCSSCSHAPQHSLFRCIPLQDSVTSLEGLLLPGGAGQTSQKSSALNGPGSSCDVRADRSGRVCTPTPSPLDWGTLSQVVSLPCLTPSLLCLCFLGSPPFSQENLHSDSCLRICSL